MSIEAGKCTYCNQIINVDNTKDANICEYCGKPYITKTAIDLYNKSNNMASPSDAPQSTIAKTQHETPAAKQEHIESEEEKKRQEIEQKIAKLIEYLKRCDEHIIVEENRALIVALSIIVILVSLISIGLLICFAITHNNYILIVGLISIAVYWLLGSKLSDISEIETYGCSTLGIDFFLTALGVLGMFLTSKSYERTAIRIKDLIADLEKEKANIK